MTSGEHRPMLEVNIPKAADGFRVSGEAAEEDPNSPCSTGSNPLAMKERILNAVLRNVGQTKFLPADAINSFTTEEEVKSVLAEEEIPVNPGLVTFGSGVGKRVILALVYVEKLKALESLRRTGFDDSQLPIQLEQKPREKTKKKKKHEILFRVASLDEGSNTPKPQRWDAFDDSSNWDNMSLENFESFQWLFLAPVFTKDKFQHVFHPSRPLPFIENGIGDIKNGFFSRVRQHEIHEAHQLVLDQGKRPIVAVKELQREKDTYFQREADTLKIISNLKNRHHIKPIATYQIGESLCFVFPWADGGNLREFWAEADSTTALRFARDKAIVKWALEQMHGLAEALRDLYQENGRHGDLKPENILRFTESGGRGILQIADVGLAKFHIQVTQHRNAQTTTMTGTFRYEPPECDKKDPHNPRSRDYDVWSMGCIYLEFIIWLLDGQKGLERFNKPGRFRHFWDSKDGNYYVHPVVQESIESLSKRLCDSRNSDTAFKAVLDLVATRLLQVTLITDGKEGEVSRANATEMFDSMNEIYERAKIDSGYLFDQSMWPQQNAPTTQTSLVVPRRRDQPKETRASLDASSRGPGDNVNIVISPAADTPDHQSRSSIPSSGSREQEYNIPQLQRLNDNWESKPDNNFAERVFARIDWSAIRPSEYDTVLCEACKDIDVWSPSFKLEYEMPNLKERAMDCNLCRLFYQFALKYGVKELGTAQFHRIGSTITGLDGLPILSIYADPELKVETPLYAQLGFPLLPDQGGAVQRAILREWLGTCDRTHMCLPKATVDGNSPLPTRVIYVGDDDDQGLRLVDGRCQTGRYVALSHCWGKIDESQKFCTYRYNIDDFRTHIDYAQLPETYRDAVQIVRALKIRYLWIDSLCIIQNDEEDWKAESSRMEDVFSTAYFTLATTSASSSIVSFLKKREPRPCVRVDTETHGTYYACQNIDNFHRDVEEGLLNKRGWVLQERALSRRLIHFTSTQIYWECGQGVHCETLAKLINPKASFLGDSDFPKSALDYYKGGRIFFFQDLYEKYSRLGFTNEQDRPVAISGLEKRLVRAFKTRGSCGVLDSYFQRGILWQRPRSGILNRIQYPADRYVPSWSWMAYSGGITYMDIPFNGVVWSQDVTSPFNTNNENQAHSETDQATGAMNLVATARMLNLSPLEMLKRVVFDKPTAADTFDVPALRCIVVGKAKKEDPGDGPIHWVLVIKPTSSGGVSDVYERAGVGYLLLTQLSQEPATPVRVQ